MASNFLRWGGAVVILLGTLAIAGLARQDEQPEEQPEEASASTATEFLRKMYATDRTSFGDAVRLVSSLVVGDQALGEFDELLKELHDRNIAFKTWSYGENDKLRKGTLAVMLVMALKIEGGASMRIFGVSERYALRELNYSKILNGRYVDQYVSGRELIDVMQRARIFKTEGSLDSIRK